jgi:hypothetical protein
VPESSTTVTGSAGCVLFHWATACCHIGVVPLATAKLIGP